MSYFLYLMFRCDGKFEKFRGVGELNTAEVAAVRQRVGACRFLGGWEGHSDSRGMQPGGELMTD